MQREATSQAEVMRRKSRNRKIVLGFFVFLGAIVLMESPVTRVRHITVSGNTTVPEKKIVTESGLNIGQSLWQVNGAHVRQGITSHEPMVAGVNVTTSWLQGTVHLQVIERHVVALYESSGHFYNLLNNGLIYHVAKTSSGLSFPVITGSVSAVKDGQAVSPEVSTICEQLGKISDNQLANVSELHANSDGSVSLYLNNGFVVDADATGLVGAVNAMQESVNYFIQKGYKPGVIDLTGLPPYRYTPFANATAPSTNSTSALPSGASNSTK